MLKDDGEQMTENGGYLVPVWFIKEISDLKAGRITLADIRRRRRRETIRMWLYRLHFPYCIVERFFKSQC